MYLITVLTENVSANNFLSLVIRTNRFAQRCQTPNALNKLLFIYEVSALDEQLE